ncbi:response regulator [Roseivivax sp. CAU 1753]
MRILAVDDDPIILELLETVLGAAGYTDLVLARSGEQALAILETVETPFDCFLLDIMMPGIDGVELCQQVRQMPSYTAAPILMVSRLDEKRHFDRAFAAGASDYVTKPFDPTELGIRLRLADQVQSQLRKLRDTDDAATRDRIDLSDAFMLHDVPGAIDNLALDAYLERLSGNMSTIQLFALKIGNIGQIHRKATPDEFRLIVNSLADAVTDVLAGSSFFITHSGNGVLSFVVHGRIDMSMDAVVKAVLSEAGGMDFVLASGQTVIPEIVVGTGGGPRTVTRNGRRQALREAVLTAEEIATSVSHLEFGRGHPAMPAPREGFFARFAEGF